ILETVAALSERRDGVSAARKSCGTLAARTVEVTRRARTGDIPRMRIPTFQMFRTVQGMLKKGRALVLKRTKAGCFEHSTRPRVYTRLSRRERGLKAPAGVLRPE